MHQIKGIDRAAKKQRSKRSNAKESYISLEVDAPYQLRMNAFKTNVDTEIKTYESEAAEYKRLANVWGKLVPT